MSEHLTHEVLRDVELGGRTYPLAHRFTAEDGARAIVVQTPELEADVGLDVAAALVRPQAEEAIARLRAKDAH